MWSPEGTSADLDSLPVSGALRGRLIRWNSSYSEDRLPFESNDTEWLALGRTLLRELRAELGPEYSIATTEPWWDEQP